MVATLAGMALLASPMAAAERGEVELRGETTLGVRFYEFERPFDDDDLTGFFDQYRYTRHKDADVPTFVDLLHTDLGLAREDDTWLLRLERWSPNAQNERGLLDLDWRGLRVEGDYHRYRSDDLRLFPVGTGGAVPVFGTVYNPDTPPDNPLGRGKRFYTHRAGVGGSVRLRPEGFGWEVPILSQIETYSRFERRTGYRQDRFLLDEQEPLGVPGTQRFRANRGKIDQRVTTVGGGLVLRPAAGFSTVLDVGFEAFREEADPVTLGDLSADSPALPPPASPFGAARAFDFVPDTDRLSVSLESSGSLGPARLHGAGFLSHLSQSGSKAPLQKLLDLDDNELTTWSFSGGFDVPFDEVFAANGFVRAFWRKNDVDDDAFQPVGPDGGVSLDGVQLAPYQRRRREVRSGFELTARPQAGSLVAVGYRNRLVHRELRFGDTVGVIRPDDALVDEDTQQHTVYLRSSTRLLRTLQLSGELGWLWAPEVGLPREMERGLYFETRGSHTFLRPFPITLTGFGRVFDGENDDIKLAAANGARRKKFERTLWSWGLTTSLVPRAGSTLYASFVQNGDDQELSHLRSNFPRNFPPSTFELFLDSRPSYESDVRSLVVGGTTGLPAGLDLGLATTWTWTRVRFPDGGATADVLDAVDEVHNRILSVEARLGYAVSSRLRVAVGYRFDDFRDRSDLETLHLDTEKQTYTLSLTLDL